MWSWAACSDPAGAPALPVVAAVLSSGLRIFEVMGMISTCLESYLSNSPRPHFASKKKRAWVRLPKTRRFAQINRKEQRGHAQVATAEG